MGRVYLMGREGTFDGLEGEEVDTGRGVRSGYRKRG